MSDDLSVFTWSNFECFAPVLLGAEAAPSWMIDGAYGRAINYVISEEDGLGRAEYLSLCRGLRVVVFDCEWREEKTYAVRDGDWVRFNFSLDIDIAMQLNKAQSVTVSRPSWRIINNPPGVDIQETIPANTKAVWVTICCKPDFLQEITGIALEDLPDFLQEPMVSRHDQGYYEYYDFTARLNSITADILRTKTSGALRVLYIEARCMELLTLALDHLLHPSSTHIPVHLTDKDRKTLEVARETLIKTYAYPPSVSALGKDLGLNKNKLYYGFKMLFGVTISDFIQEQRLNEGKRMLQQTQLPVADIAHHVGFKHQSNFATAMKKHFGLTPRQFRA